MFLSDKECLFSITVCYMYVYTAIWNRHNLGLLSTENCPAHGGLRTICAYKQRSGGSRVVFENGCDGVRVVVITDIFELFAILRSVRISWSRSTKHGRPRTSTSIPSEHSARNLLRDTRYMRNSGMSLICSPVLPFQVGRKPGSGGVKYGSLAAV